MSQDSPDSSVQRQIDENLRRVYDDVLRQDVPDRFADLLQQLKEGQSAAPSAPTSQPDQSTTQMTSSTDEGPA
ncbi:NepR family anti-sigma factor [Pseudaestuariivita sp.]|uniref:NepR family anti-sigma factor n=1 Tax=Pseudaestuariivita sp. TaxID=2211669 RepID=UPI00405A33C4